MSELETVDKHVGIDINTLLYNHKNTVNNTSIRTKVIKKI